MGLIITIIIMIIIIIIIRSELYDEMLLEDIQRLEDEWVMPRLE